MDLIETLGLINANFLKVTIYIKLEMRWICEKYTIMGASHSLDCMSKKSKERKKQLEKNGKVAIFFYFIGKK